MQPAGVLPLRLGSMSGDYRELYALLHKSLRHVRLSPMGQGASMRNDAESIHVPVPSTQLVRLQSGVLGFALTAIFYIRWNDQWFRQHAEQEFRLQQLALDVDRAGYATEMLLEWQEDKGGEMPAVMVDRLTAGLFTDQTKVERVRHPSEDAIAAVLKAASSVRVDVPGIGELSLTGRQIRKVDRSLAKKRISG